MIDNCPGGGEPPVGNPPPPQTTWRYRTACCAGCRGDALPPSARCTRYVHSRFSASIAALQVFSQSSSAVTSRASRICPWN